MKDEDNPRLKEWKRKLRESQQQQQQQQQQPPDKPEPRRIIIEAKPDSWRYRLLQRWYKIVGRPEDQVNPFGKDVHIVVGILQRIVLVNLIAFCTVMVFLIIVEATKPTPATPVEKPQAPTVYERAQKDY
jgi:hypothetical protein